MGYYNKDFFIEETEVYKEERDSWKNKAFTIANIIHNNSKKHHIKTFFPKTLIKIF